MRSKLPLHLIPALSVALLATGCSQKAEDAAADAGPAEQSAASANGGEMASSPDTDTPGLTSAAAAGVAFNYRYAFTLPTKAISAVQQQHAVACERLGPTRCRITGMSYDQPRREDASASLDLLIAPELAQRFGADAVAAVERADGVLETANVAGNDAEGAIDDSQQRSGLAAAALARIEKRLQIKGLGADERRELLRRADELRGQLGEQRLDRQAKEASLAMTPMTFAYGSAGVFASSGNPFGHAAKVSLGSLQSLTAILLTIGGIALPWLLVFALVVLAARVVKLKRRLATLDRETPAQGEVTS